MFGWQSAGVHPVRHEGRPRQPRQHLPCPPHDLAVAAVEADGQETPRPAGLRKERGDLGLFETQRLLHQDVFSGAKRLERLRRVQMVPGPDEHQVDRGVLHDLQQVGRGAPKTEAPRRVAGVERRRRGDDAQSEAARPLNDRQMDRLHEAPGAADGDAHLARAGGERLERVRCRGRSRRPRSRTIRRGPAGAEGRCGGGRRSLRRRRIAQQDADRPVTGRFIIDRRVRRGRLREREDPVDERAQRHPAVAHQIEEGRHVAIERKADVRRRVVDPSLLVRWIVAPGPVGSADEQIELLLVHERPVEVEPHVADDDHPPLPAAQAHRQVRNLRRVRLGADQHGVGEQAARDARHLLARVARGEVISLEAEAPAARRAPRIEIEP